MNVKFYKTRYILLCAALTITAAALIIFPERYSAACFKGFILWAECVLPSLFPFLVVTLLFIKSGLAEKASLPLERAARRLKMPDCFAVCFIMSVCSGYPAGSRIVREFYDGGATDGLGAKKLAALCSTSGPLFIIGSLGAKMFADKRAGVLIFCAHVISCIAVAFIYSLKSKPVKPSVPAINESPKNILYDCFYSAVISVCMAGAFIAFFYCAAQIANDFNFLYLPKKLLSPLLGGELAKAVCTGLIEATSGCAAAAASGSRFALPCAGFLITFGGASIILQQLSYLSGAKVGAWFFIKIKFCQAALCFLLLLPFAFV